MKRKSHIFVDIVDMDNLRNAHRNARKDKSFYKEVKMVNANEDYYLKKIQDMLIGETYEVSDYEIKTINDSGKERKLMKLPYFPDRIIQWAIMLQIHDVFEKHFCYHTCASLPNRGIKRAVDLTKKYLKDKAGTEYCLKIDIKKFYDSVDHEILKSLLKKKFKDPDLEKLVNKIIDSVPNGKGVPIGSYLSQYLGNYYLSYFDHWLKEAKHQKYVVRYMDDVIILGDNKEELHQLRRDIEIYLHENLRLQLKGNWQVFPTRARGIDFVGYRFFGDYTLARKSTVKRLKRKCRNCMKKYKLNYHDFCSLNSYEGWLLPCDSYRLETKYIKPLKPKLYEYYREEILNAKSAGQHSAS